MKTINVYLDEQGPFLCSLEVEENPYDDGYLLSPSDVEEILLAWRDRPAESDVVRQYEFGESNAFAVTSLLLEGELSISIWPNTTDYHVWNGSARNDGTPAFSTMHWPFDFHVTEGDEVATLRALTEDEILEGLRAWAKGSLPMMAAIEFLAESDAFLKVPSMFVRVMHGRVWFDAERLDDALTSGELGYMSGGEISTWQLVSSLFNGELNRAYWRLDPQRQAAFTKALEAHR